MSIQKDPVVAHTASQVDGTIIYNFPPTRFVNTNTFEKQLDHIISEVDEIEQLEPILKSTEDTQETSRVRRLLEL